MAEPRSRRDIFAVIKPEAIVRSRGGNRQAAETWVQTEIERYNSLYPRVMRNAKYADYLDYVVEEIRKDLESTQREQDEAARTTPQEFFDAAYDFNPIKTSTPIQDTKLVKLLCSHFVPPMPLGKVYGNTVLWLLPGPDSLPLSPILAQNFTSFSPALADSGAIKYPDGHPSIEYQKQGSMYRDTVDPNQDGKLRRFWPLGWIAYKHSEDTWERTGHVLIMDMDTDHNRDRDPWLILASKWPDSNADGDTDEMTIRAKQSARHDDSEIRGIFPGDSRRTPIAKIVRIGPVPLGQKVPLLKQFSSSFQFGLYREGGDRDLISSRKFSDFHPDLAHVMGWYWDDIAKEEVCYAENGKEFMRRNPATGKYRNLDLDAVPMAGQVASWGEVLEVSEAVSLRSQMQDPDARTFVSRERYKSTSASFSSVGYSTAGF